MNYGKKGVSRKEKQLTSTASLVRRKFSVIFFKTLLVFFLAAIVIGGCAGIGVFKGVIDSAPDISDIDPTPTGYLSVVLDNQGNQTAKLVASGSNRVYVTLDEIPEDLQHAFVAIEDERFYEHNGIDIKGIIRAGFTGIANGFHFSQGASTITQQLLKNNVFEGWTNQSGIEKVKRKIQEQYLAIELSKVKSKDWILENYLNTINLGQNTLGVQSASRRYFGKDVSELTLSEGAVIAGITKNPSAYNPVSHPEENNKRRKLVLKNMKDQNYISEKEYNEALKDDVYSRIQQVNIEYGTDNPNSYFVDALIDQVARDLVEKKGYTDTQAYKALYNSGLTIESTQDMGIQQICDEEVNNQENYSTAPQYSFSYRLTVEDKDGSIKNYSDQTMISYYSASSADYSLNFSSREEAQAAIDAYKAAIMEPGDTIVEGGESVVFTLQPQAAVTIMDQYTGDVKAIVGGRGDKSGSRTLNRATDTTRQPGSTFKVLAAYAPALDTAGMTLATVQDDAPFSYANGTSLRNYDNSYRGFTTIRYAITKSINVVTVKTLTDISPQTGYDYLTNFGFTTLTEDDIVQSLALGGITQGVTNLELTAAYATIADGGTYTKPRFYTRILDHNGNVLIDNNQETHTVLKESTAFLLTSAMQDVITVGTGGAVNFGTMPIAGKTGTTTKNRDALFAGFTPYYTCSVWCGYDDNSPQDSALTANPKTLWRNIMGRIHENLEYKDFTQPEGITTAAVCKKSGKLAVEGLCDADPRGSMVETEFFAAGTVPTEYCDHHVSATVCTASGMLANEFCPQENRQGGIYIVGGSPDTEDGPFLLSDSLSQENYCTVHTAASVIPEIPEIQIPDDDTQGGGKKPNKDDKEHTNDKKDEEEPPEDELPGEDDVSVPPEDTSPEGNGPDAVPPGEEP
ncbi:PBP1A family penicillin-binding protein [Petralouisia muris]|uniref:PBP1A family penicillin-binding protein n=1 Tax=Petralouisia muris TaxID=3032872 RepID=A0AC61RVZ4_9FIRM|nr:PBP1A family penicillin-binding protein [Petralouisia muris]TGY96013.1 PBP1A family penicillin-binding protein [Petralouisia muris]